MRIRSCLGILALLALSLTSCKGKDGTSYEKYSWFASLSYIDDTNPSAGNYVYNDEYFRTGTGTFYLEYEYLNSSYGAWYGYYTITRNDGKPFMEDGDDLWFEIDLYDSIGPVLYKWTSERGVTTTNDTLKTSLLAAGVPEKSMTVKKRESSKLGPILGTQTYTTSAGTVTLEYGKVLQ